MTRQSLFCKFCSNPLESDGSCKMCPAGNKRRTAPTDKIDRACPWNDHGNICGLVGSLSDNTLGTGPWYCSRHWWKLKGYPERAGAEHTPYRNREFPNSPSPNLDGTSHLKPMADKNGDLMRRLHSGLLGHLSRQPGEDLDDLMQP